MPLSTEDNFFLRGRMFGASLEALKDFISFCSIDVDGDKEDRVAYIESIEKWLEEQAWEIDGGAIGFRALKQILDEHDDEVNTMTIKAEPTSPAKPSQADSSPKPVTSAFRREFKIYGAIDSKSGVFFISLVRQINTGLEKGYTNGEIVDAIIRAVPANTGLRNYLEGKQ